VPSFWVPTHFKGNVRIRARAPLRDAPAMQTTFTRVAGHCCEVTSFDIPAPTEGDTRLARMTRDGSIEYVRGADTNADGTIIGGWRARVRAVPLPLADDSEFMCEPYSFFNVYVTRVNGTSHLFAIDSRGVTPEIDDGRGSECPVLTKRAARASACLKGLSIDNKDPPTDIRLPTLGELTRLIHQPTEREVDAASAVIFVEGV